jgi:predicted AAA+ superfamily ATPase
MFQSLLSLYNPWWINPDWDQKGVDRELYQKIINSIRNSPYVTVLKGCRQSGKTFLITQCIATLLKEGVSPQNIFYFLLDDPELANYIENNPNEFGNFLRNEMQSKGKMFVFFDEFQKVKGITELTKIFYETGSQIKFVLTGSSSLTVADNISESLLGRTETFILYPFSFREFLSIHISDLPFSFPLEKSYQPISNFLKDPKNSFKELSDFYSQYHYAFENFSSQFLPRYLLTGGYPQAALASGIEDSLLRLKEIKQTFIEKDIIKLLRIEKLKEFESLLRVLAIQSCNLINFSDLQTTVGINYETLKNFLNIVEAAYLWFPISVFSTNKITSIKKQPKAYFNDVGLRNFLVSTFDLNQAEKEKGLIAENFVYNQLTKFNQNQLNGLAQIQFWRSPDGNEIDFIFKYAGKLLPIEVKYQRTRQIKISRGFQTFLQKMELEQAILISDDIIEIRRTNNCDIFIIPIIIFSML